MINEYNIKPSIWGSSAWHILHNISINANINDKNRIDYIQFLNIFQQIIPCDNCKKDFKVKCSLLDLDKIDNNNFNMWLYSIHNIVNKEINKPLCEYDKHILYHSKTDNKKYRKFIEILLEIMGDNPSLEEFMNVYTFIEYICKVYPSKCNIKSSFKNLI